MPDKERNGSELMHVRQTATTRAAIKCMRHASFAVMPVAHARTQPCEHRTTPLIVRFIYN
eukprot:6465553-Amphidinium_carterae.1